MGDRGIVRAIHICTASLLLDGLEQSPTFKVYTNKIIFQI